MDLRKSSILIIYYPFNLALGFNFTKILQEIVINVFQKRLNQLTYTNIIDRYLKLFRPLNEKQD